MARIPLVTREQIAEKEQPAYDGFMQRRAGRPNVGPYSLLATTYELEAPAHPTEKALTP